MLGLLVRVRVRVRVRIIARVIGSGSGSGPGPGSGCRALVPAVFARHAHAHVVAEDLGGVYDARDRDEASEREAPRDVHLVGVRVRVRVSVRARFRVRR